MKRWLIIPAFILLVVSTVWAYTLTHTGPEIDQGVAIALSVGSTTGVIQSDGADNITGLGLVTTVGSPGLDTNVPTEKAVRDGLDAVTGTGEANTGANTGDGVGKVFRDKSGVFLNFKSIKAGSNISIVNNPDDITINSTGGGGGGSGDVTGPSSSTANNIAVFSDATGKVIKEVPANIDDSGAIGSYKLKILSAPPAVPEENVTYLADCTTWNPVGGNCSEPYEVTWCSDCDSGSSAYFAKFEYPNKIPVTAIMTPSYAHFANADASYSDTTTPHVLTDSETKNTILTNCGATEDRVYTSPAYSFGMYFQMVVCAAFQMDLEPPSGGRIWINGVQADINEHIINAGDTKPESMVCYSAETSNDTYELFCESKYSNWVEATP